MFVAELDRPWLETPFALQGFVIRNRDEIDYVSNYVDHVYVDTEYRGYKYSLKLASSPEERVRQKRLAIRKDYKKAQATFASASTALDKVYDSLRNGNEVDIVKVRDAISPLIESVFRNQEAVAALLRLQDSGDYRYQHGLSMAVWAAILGRHIGLHREELEKLVVGCAMCDVGMTQLPRELLDQAQHLSGKQTEIIHAHTKIGVEMVSNSDDVDAEVLAIIEFHHERMDGSGYPWGMEGFAIPLLARIAGLVDAYDAMISPRPYAKARTSHEATQELLDMKGSKLQDSLVEQFVQAIGLFPTGTLVELNGGEVGIVVAQNTTRRLKPEVLLILDEDKKLLPKPRIIDLANQDIAANGERWITHELLAGSYGIKSDEYFI